MSQGVRKQATIRAVHPVQQSSKHAYGTMPSTLAAKRQAQQAEQHELLAREFGLVASAPNGVKKLRSLVVDLAMRGKLTPQDPNDEPVKKLLERIKTEKGNVADSRYNEITKLFSNCEAMFNLPETWEWVPATYPAKSISDSGKKVQTKEVLSSGMYPVVDQGKVFIRGYCNDSSKVISVKSPLIIFGDHTRETKLIDFDFVVGADGVKILQPICLLASYYYLALSWLPIDSRGYGRHFKLLKSAQIPLPPIEEQKRIVSKVDELMVLCDRMEAQQADAEAAHETLVKTLLDAPTQSQDAADFNASWARISENFDTLFNTEASIDALKQTVLQLAVIGNLVAQYPNDGSASELLVKIHSEKNKLITNGKIKKDKSLNQSSLANEPKVLPKNWAQISLETIAHVGTGATPLRTKPEYFAPAEVRWLTSGETSASYVYETEQRVSALALKETNLTVYPKGTLVVAMYGQGKTRGQITELMVDACTNQACAAISLFLKDQDHRKYIKLFFEKIYDEIRELAAGGAQPNLNLGMIKNTIIPLPPLAEQRRIVAKVDELMAICDTLKARITESKTLHEQLADALVKQGASGA
jgi:type I restriction enzyme S subunit